MKRNRNKILITILVITIILLILCVIYVMYQMNTQHKEQDDYSKLASSVAPSLAEEVTSPSIDETLADNPIIVICFNHDTLAYRHWNIKPICIFYQHKILSLESSYDSTAYLTKEAYFISYFHCCIFNLSPN